MTNEQLTLNEKIDEKRAAVDNWLIKQITDKIEKTSIISSRISKPFVLFRNILEESGTSAQEEVAVMNGKYIIIQVFTYGNYLPSSFQKVQVFTLEKFPKWIIKRNRELLLQSLDSLDELGNLRQMSS
jgi:hypothetical protein